MVFDFSFAYFNFWSLAAYSLGLSSPELARENRANACVVKGFLACIYRPCEALINSYIVPCDE